MNYEKESHAWKIIFSCIKQIWHLQLKIVIMISHDDCMCVIHMSWWILKLGAREEEHKREIELNEKWMEWRKSNGLVATEVIGATTMKLPGWLDWSPKEKWCILKDCKEEKGVHSLGCAG